MKILQAILLVLLPIMVYSSCVTVEEQDHVFPTQNEYFRWQIRRFIHGDSLTYSIDNSNIFRLEEPYHQLGDDDIHPATDLDIIAIRAYDIPETGAWTNDFAVMGSEENGASVDWVIYYAEGKQTLMNQAPKFRTRLDFITNRPLMKCYDLEYVDRDTFLVDCMERQTDGTTGKNYVVFVKKGDPFTVKMEEVPNHYGYDIVSDRKVQYHVYNTQNIGEQLNEEKPQRILLRGQYAYGTPTHSITNLDGNCIIELLQNNETNDIVDALKVLNKGVLINDLKIPADQHETFQFTLIDFKIVPNGDVYILDAFNGIYVYYIKDDSTWQYKKKYDIGTEMAYAFDVNYKIDWQGMSHLHIVVMHKNLVVEYVDGVQQKGFIGTFDAKHPSFIFASQQFIVVNTANNYYLYNSDHSYLIYSHQMITKQYLVNPYEPDVIAFSQSWTRRYEIGYARISVYSTDATLEENTVYFQAKDKSEQICKASLKYQIIKKDDTNIYDVDHDPFPQVVTYPSDPFFVQEIAAGPNLIYTNGDNSAGDHVIVDVHTVWELNVTGLVWPVVTEVTYADILVDPHWTDKTKFWFLFQHANKQVEIYECKAQGQVSQNVDCENHAKFVLPNTLDNKKSQFDWYAEEGDSLTIQFLENDYQISFYTSDHDQTEPAFSLTYEKIVDNTISSFTVLKNGIYVVLPNIKQVDAWFGFYPKETKFIINQATVKNQGSTYTFEPKKVFGNPALKSEFILIQSKDCIFFGDMRETFTLIYEFPIIANAEVQVYLGIRTLFIIQKNNNAYKIDEWNYESLSNIYWMKTLPLYNRYEIQSPLTTDFCYETGYLFVRAFDTKLFTTVILVYESEVLSQLSLHKVVNTHLLVPDGTTMSMTAAGHEQMYMYVNNKDSVQKMVGFLRDAIMTLTPTHLSNQYVTLFNAAVNVTNQENSTPKKISYPVKFINTQTYVTIDQEALTKSNSLFNFTDQTADQYVNINTEGWQNGQVIKYKADCEQCGSHLIEIVNPVYHITEGSQYQQKFVDGVATGTRMIFQTTDSLIFQDEKGDRAGTYKLPISGSYNDCMSITASDDGKIVFTGCIDQNNVFIYLSFCDGKNCTAAEPKSQQVANGAKYPAKLLYKDGLLFILDNNHDRPTLYDGSVRVHQVKLDEANKKWDLDAGVVINSKYLSTEISIPFQPSDFDVIKYEVGNFNYYKILTTSAQYRIYFIDLYWDNGALKFAQHDKFDLYDLITRKFVMKIDTRFYQVRSLKQTVKDKKLLCTALISTNNLATYATTFTFDVSDPTNKGAPVSTTATVPFLLSNYGTWTNLNKMAVYDDHAALAYTDNVNVMVAVYKLPAIDHSALSEEAETKIITLVGGEKDQQYSSITTYFVLTLSKDATLERPVLHTNLVYSIQAQETLLLKYGITDYPRLFVQQGNTIKEQEVFITAYNDYNAAHGVLKLTKVSPGPGPNPPGPTPDDDDKGGSHWVLITVLCIVGVAVLAVGGYFLYTKVILKKNKPLHVQSY